MKTKEEIKQWLLENAVDELGNIDLSDIDFGNKNVFFSGVKAELIYNDYQEANEIYNDRQKANLISNMRQEATWIHNTAQKAKTIHNENQQAKVIYRDFQKSDKIDNLGQLIKPSYEQMSKKELIARIRELEDDK